MKQIVAVLEAVELGCVNSHEVSALTGLSIKTASSWLSQLACERLIVAVEKRKLNRQGHVSNIYRLFDARIDGGSR